MPLPAQTQKSAQLSHPTQSIEIATAKTLSSPTIAAINQQASLSGARVD